MKTLILWFSGILLILSGNLLFAQHIHKNYTDGEIYIKLKKVPQGQVILPNGAVNMASELPFLQKAGAISNTLRARRSFYFSNSTTLQKVYRVRIGKPKQIQKFIKEILKDPNVEYVEPVPYYKTFSLPNDASLADQTYLTRIKAPEAWNIAQSNTDVTVAVIDNAIQTNHIDLAGNMLAGKDISDNDNDPGPPDESFWHGTHVAGVIGAVSNNTTGIASMGLNHVKVLPVKAVSNAGSADDITDGYEAIAWAVENGAKIINLSWGSGGYSVTEQAVINSAHEAGAIIIASMGNEGKNEPYYPAYYNHVIAVASVTSTDEKSFFSNYGTGADLSAPGSAVYSTIPFNKFDYSSGTSMAAPVVSSVFAYIWSVKPLLTAAELERLILNTTDNIDSQNPDYKGMLGTGRINALRAVSCVEAGIQPVITPSATTVLCSGNTVQLSSNTFDGASYQWKKDGVNIGSNQATFTATETGQYTVEVTRNTCVIRAESVKVSVVPNTVNIISAYTVACAGDSILLTAPNLAGVTYQWKKDGSDIGRNAYQLYAKQNGSYTVVLSGNSCEKASSAVSLSFITLSAAITNNGPSFICSGQNTMLSTTESGGASYQWLMNGEVISGATSLNYTVTGTGEYQVAHQVGQCVVRSDKLTIVQTTQKSTAPSVTNREICEGKSLAIGNGLQASATVCVGALTRSYVYTGGVISYDGDAKSGNDPAVTIADLDTHKVRKIRVMIAFEKKDQTGINDCGLPHGGSFPFNDEISFKVKSPNGTIITLLASDTYGSYVYGGQVNVTFEDGKSAIPADATPQSGTFAPAEALSAFVGQTASGTWTLLPNDNFEGDPLCVSAFSVEIQVSNFMLPNSFTWWSAATGGIKLGTSGEFVAPDVLSGVHTYYVQNECLGSCPSDRAPVTLTISTASLAPPAIIAYAITPTLASEIQAVLPHASLSSQSPATIQYDSHTKIISDKAPLIDPITVCSSTHVLLLGTGCSGVLRWVDSSTGAGTIVTPATTSVYSVRCKDQNTGCLSPASASRTVYVKPDEITISNTIPDKGQQTFTAKKITATSVAHSTSSTIVKADNSVVFLPGFKADGGSVFTAVIEPACGL